MSQTTPDIRQLSYCCGKQMTWTHIPMEGEPDGYTGQCSSCGMEWSELLEPVRGLLPTEDLLLARIATLEAENAELMATLANERGEGEAPVEGWRYIPSLGDWQAPTGVVRRISWLRLPDGTSKACWGWERWEADGGRTDGVCDTARAAMRAASGAP